MLELDRSIVSPMPASREYVFLEMTQSHGVIETQSFISAAHLDLGMDKRYSIRTTIQSMRLLYASPKSRAFVYLNFSHCSFCYSR